MHLGNARMVLVDSQIGHKSFYNQVCLLKDLTFISPGKTGLDVRFLLIIGKRFVFKNGLAFWSETNKFFCQII